MLRLPRRRRRILVPLAVLLTIACRDDTPAPEPEPEPEPAASQPPKVEVFVRGARYHGTNGIAFGPDGLLYMASVVTPALAAIDPETGEVKTQWGAAEGVKGPDDVAFGPDGSAYWTDIAYGDVGRRAPDGKTTVVGSPGPGVNPITFSDDGRLFVSQCFLGDKLFEIDPLGVKEPRLISDQLGPGCGLNGMDWGPDDKLYGPRWFQHSVARVDVANGRIETVAEGFGVPAAVKFDSKGRLHVLDSLAGEVVRVDIEAGTREVVGTVPPSSADNLAFDAKDRLFVSSFGDAFIVEVLGGGNTRTVLQGGVTMPGGLALAKRGGDGGSLEVGASDVLYLADFYALRGFDLATGEEIYAAHDIIGFSEIGSTMTVAADGGRLITSSWFDNAVKIWDPTKNQVVASFTGLKRPVSARAFQGDVVVAEWDTGSVLRLKAAEPEVRTAIATGIASPAGLAASNDDLYVADRDGGRILQVVDGGAVLSPVREVARGLGGPEGIELGDDGLLYVVESDADRVSTVDPATGETKLVADGLALHVPSQGSFPSTMLFNGIALGAKKIYVTGDVENVIYSIARQGK